MGINVALVIGHTADSKGACNAQRSICEYDFNQELVHAISNRLAGTTVNPVVVHRDSYKKLPKKINSAKPDFAISFHCNAFNTKVSGTETLYYADCEKSKMFAGAIHSVINAVMGLKDRGIKSKRSEDRGGYLLSQCYKYKIPTVILEPFFIDNDDDLAEGLEKQEELVSAIVNLLINMDI